MIAHAAPPAPAIVAGPPVAFGGITVRLGAGTRLIEVQRDGRIIVRRSVPAGPRRLSVALPAGVGAVRVRAVGSGGARWSAAARIRVLPRSALRAGRLPGFVDAPLQRDVDRLVSGMPAISGVYVQHLVSGCGASYNADAQFPAASTLKAAILVDAVRRGRAAQLAPVLDRMIRDSDDVAANQALAALGNGSGETGAASVTDTLHRLGLGRSLVRRPYIIEDTRRPLPITTVRAPALFTNFITTPFELARLMVAIHRGAVGKGGVAKLGIGSHAARVELLARLLDVRDTSKLVAGVPAGVPVAHKTGYTQEVKHDGGIIYLASGPVVAAVMTWSASGISDAVGDRLIADVARVATRRLVSGGSCPRVPIGARGGHEVRGIDGEG